MIPELAVTMLACARIGAVHSIIFGGFSADSISGRVNDCESQYIITADEGVRGGKTIPLKAITDEAPSELCCDAEKHGSEGTRDGIARQRLNKVGGNNPQGSKAHN